MIWVPDLVSSRGSKALTLPCVPTGMKTGVSISPRAVVTRPRRALLVVSVFNNSHNEGRLKAKGQRLTERNSALAFSPQPLALRNEIFTFPSAGASGPGKGLGRIRRQGQAHRIAGG